ISRPPFKRSGRGLGSHLQQRRDIIRNRRYVRATHDPSLGEIFLFFFPLILPGLILLHHGHNRQLCHTAPLPRKQKPFTQIHIFHIPHFFVTSSSSGSPSSSSSSFLFSLKPN